jgi:hypothetical protein
VTLHLTIFKPDPAGTEWRNETFCFSDIAKVPVETIAVSFLDGKVADYSVEITDRDSTFHVWARNHNEAAELQYVYGNARAVNDNWRIQVAA